MSIFSNLFTTNTKVVFGTEKTELQRMTDYLNFVTNNFNIEQGENISSVYTACKILAEDVGSFPLDIFQNEEDGAKSKIKDDSRYALLHYNPNGYTTSNTFFSNLEYLRNVKGNAFAKINRDNDGFVTSLTSLLPWQVQTYKIVNGELFYLYKKDYDSDSEWVAGREFLHFRSITNDGVWGMNPIEKLRLNLSTTHKAFTSIDKFYDNNATSPKALKTSIPTETNPKEWQASMVDFHEKYGSFKNAGKVITLPPFTELQDIALSFVDAELISTIRFNVDQIAALYKIPPHMLGNFESSKFNNLEQLQLNYKVNTLRPILRMYRQELEFKLLTTQERLNGISIEFNTNALMETDAKTRIENLKNMFGMGVITPNEIAKHEGHATNEQGGDKHYLLNQYMTVEDYDIQNNAPTSTPPAPKSDVNI